eukprot:Amastigsp_a680949_59.p3 type:complete len:184 gc:universal Amastigsp_a680949_59:710-159(-)
MRPSGSTMGSLPILRALRISFASASDTPSGAVTSAVVITAESGVVARFGKKSMSLFVTMPRSLEPILPSAVMGTPLNPWRRLIASTSAIVLSGSRQMGSEMNPFLYFLTAEMKLTCSSIVQFEWMMPIPPLRAMAIAMVDVVTVSMGLETNGTASETFFESLLWRTTSEAAKPMWPGRMIMSS